VSTSGKFTIVNIAIRVIALCVINKIMNPKVTYCCVPLCTGRNGYHFPRQKSLRDKWIVAVGRHDLIRVTQVVCRGHYFRSEDFQTDVIMLAI
jgi:hypothetical protein